MNPEASSWSRTTLQILADHDLNEDILRALLARRGTLDILRVREIGPRTMPDDAVLEYASENGRIVLTHDRTTMPDELWRRMATGSLVPVVIVIPRDLSPGRVADELLAVFDSDDAPRRSDLAPTAQVTSSATRRQLAVY